jgi:RHS repeat-associated protein
LTLSATGQGPEHRTKYIYNENQQLTSLTRPSGLITTNTFYQSGTYQNWVLSTVETDGWVTFRTNGFTYENGLVATRTDERGLVVNYYWDDLQRLTGQSFPDGTGTTNLYTILDLTAVKDRLDHWSFAGYNTVREKVAETNANGVITRYGYCECGALLSQTNAWNSPVQQVINFGHDLQGRLTNTAYADPYSVTNWFDSLGRVYRTGDGAAYKLFYFNNQGLNTSVVRDTGVQQATVFDLEDRPLYVTDANGVTVTNSHDLLGRVLSRTYPDGGAEAFGYSARGLIAYTNQIGSSNFFGCDAAGRKTSETNANGEVISYTYSAAGDLLTLTDGKNQTTTWAHDVNGRVISKLDQAGAEILRYNYDAEGRLTNRWSAAKGDTFYFYDPVGNLTNIAYPASPQVTLAYDALNRLTAMVDAAGTTVYSYTAGDQLRTEDGPFASDTVTNTYQNRFRVALALQQPDGLWTNGFAYDSGARLTNVTSEAGAFGYEYCTGVGGASGFSSPLVKRLLLPNTAAITNDFDSDSRMLGTYLRKTDATLLNKHAYTYNQANQRKAETRADGSSVAYTYDPIGQLVVSDSSVSTEDRGYTYDKAWNLSYRTNAGTLQTFQVNGLNELTNAPGPAGAMTFDANGNLATAHSGWVYSYDDENRLVQIEDTSSSRAFMTKFVYDGLGRLRQRLEYNWESWADYLTNNVPQDMPPPPDGGFWVPSSETHYLYDGLRVIQERDGGNVPTVSYTRGKDLSGTLQVAGGIGGLLARSHGYTASTGHWTTHNYYHADGNGNITFMLDANQSMAAEYRYDPFGSTTSSSGPLAAANIYRFSSKEIHVPSGLYYYLYRFYGPNLQRWVSVDPLGEHRGADLYAFCLNVGPNAVDPVGLDVYKIIRKTPNDALDGLAHHRLIVADDGAGGSYQIEVMNPSGKGADSGDIQYTAHHGQTATEVIESMRIQATNSSSTITIDNHVQTSTDTDSGLNEDAKKLNRHGTFYIFLFNDCGTFANDWIDKARGAEDRTHPKPTDPRPVGRPVIIW